MIIGRSASHSLVDKIQEVRKQVNVAVSLRDGVGLNKKSIKLSCLIITRQYFMLQVVVVPMAKINGLLKHLIEDLASSLRQSVTHEDISQRGQTILHT